MVTWTELTTAEPRLLGLEQEVRTVAGRAVGDPDWSFSRYWSLDLRPALRPLVGWSRTGPGPAELRTEQAWQIAVDHLVALLPDEAEAMGVWAS